MRPAATFSPSDAEKKIIAVAGNRWGQAGFPAEELREMAGIGGCLDGWMGGVSEMRLAMAV